MPSDKPVRITTQAGHARADLLTRLVYFGVPWAIFAAITIMGNALYIALGKVIDHGQYIGLTAALVLLAGIGTAGLDRHLRRHRMTLMGRNIGPVSIGAGTAMTATFLLAGYSVPLVLVWAFGGLAGCMTWDAWLHHAASHDLTIGFAANAEKSGLGQAQLVAGRRPREVAGGKPAPGAARPARPGRRITGTVHLPPGEVTPDEAAQRAAALEGAHHWPPGAASLVPNARDGSVADFQLTDPDALVESFPWPGPSAPGATMSAPFRLAVRQDGAWFTMRMVPVRHTRTTGMTGSGKTMSYLYNRLAEGVTRQGYAAFAVDLTKRWQFLGPMKAALHGAAVDPDGALSLMAGLERVRVARMDWMAGHHITEWSEDCGLSYFDISMEELGEILALLKAEAKGPGGRAFDIATWLTNVRAARSAGMSWNTSNQSGKHTSFPTDGRGSFYPLTFGLVDANDVAPALSERQAKAGCRPTLWQDGQPGTAYADHPGMEENTFSVPLRFFYWGPDGRLMADYAAQWPAEQRPLDDVSAEALANVPGRPASSASGYGGQVPGSGQQPRPRPAAPPEDDGTVVAGPWASPRPARAAYPQDTAAVGAEAALWSLLMKMYAEGTEVAGAPEIMTRPEFAAIGRSRPWLYKALEGMEAFGRTVPVEGNRRLWRIVPPRRQRETGEA